jgi:uncharacterized protein
MKNPFVGLLVLILSVAPAAAETSVWKAQKGDSVLYLGATCHILRKSDYPLPPEFDKAYKASKSLVFETDISKLEEPATQMKLLSLSVYKDGSSVEQHLKAKTFAELSAYCKSNGMPIQALSHFRPSMLMVTLMVRELMKHGIAEQGVDAFYQDLARQDGKPFEGLETVDEQIDYVTTMADGNEDDFVLHSLRDMGEIKDQFDAMADAWRSGNAAKVNELMVAELKTEMPKLYKRLITERNRKWLSSIDAYAKTPAVEFILVGAAHLVGPDGLVETLKKKGYKVEKL